MDNNMINRDQIFESIDNPNKNKKYCYCNKTL